MKDSTVMGESTPEPGSGSQPGLRLNEFMAVEVQPRTGGVNLELRGEIPTGAVEGRGEGVRGGGWVTSSGTGHLVGGKSKKRQRGLWEAGGQEHCVVTPKSWEEKTLRRSRWSDQML